MQTVWYGISSFVFGVLLFFPVRKLMLSMSINRLQRKVNRAATGEEIDALKKKVTPIAAALAVTFAFIYNKVLILKLLETAAR
jgi:hypothetical protein